ncbi:hypothetical protein L1987_01695 [Smallanthus sonchifolius]|uniref:Uncharacterized protein n=1 Tax=Smallanthus sonchifolius TaxID=185202 RepID=A0ACB9K5R8_9ASTR|nr:hypothetical protein L1987_01695 [Smallanthus sonchifolius]
MYEMYQESEEVMTLWVRQQEWWISPVIVESEVSSIGGNRIDVDISSTIGGHIGMLFVRYASSTWVVIFIGAVRAVPFIPDRILGSSQGGDDLA